MDIRIAVVLTVLSVVPASAQFSSMATDYAGQRLLFTTELSQTGTGQPDYGKLFIADWRGVQPLLTYNHVVFSTTGLYPGQPGLLTNFYNVDGVHLSSNGAYVSVMAARECQGYTAGLCRYADQSTLYDAKGQVSLTADGRLRVSSNGKWALGVGSPISAPITEFILYDLVNGATYRMMTLPTRNWQWWLHDIADDGTAVVAFEVDGPVILRAPATILHTNLGGAQSAVIDAAGNTIVWESAGLYMVRTADLGKPFRLGGPSDFQPHISDDGSRIQFLSPIAGNTAPQVFVMNTDGSGRRQVTAEPDGIANAVLSGDGRIAWAQTRTGRLLKMDIANRTRTQYTESLAAFLKEQDIAPAAYVTGTPGAVLSVPASVMPGESVEVTVQGQVAPVLRLEPRTVVFQIPLDLAPLPFPPQGVAWLQLAIRKPDSPSWSGNTLNLVLSSFGPRLETSVHEDFSAVITADKPAQPGEIVHFFGTGFVPVIPAAPNGAPAPAAPSPEP